MKERIWDLYAPIYKREMKADRQICDFMYEGILIAPNFVEHRGTLGSRIWSLIMRIAGIRFEQQWTAREYLSFLEEQGWHVTYSREMAARIVMMYTECKRNSKAGRKE